jgi:integrase
MSTRYLQLARASLARAIRYAEAHDLVGRNVATLVDNPKGQVGRPSRSFTLEQSLALLESARESRLNAYVVLSLATGIRTEEPRELHWDHVDLDGDPGAARPAPPSVAVWRSVRECGDTKTAKSRRTLALPQAAVQALRDHRKRQAEDRLAAGSLWQDHGLVFASAVGTPLDAANVRREFRQITVPGHPEWRCRDTVASLTAHTGFEGSLRVVLFRVRRHGDHVGDGCGPPVSSSWQPETGGPLG